MEFQVKTVLTLNASNNASLASIEWQNSSAYVACAGSGAVLQPINADGSASITDQKFYYEVPGTLNQLGTPASPRPRSSPSSSPTSVNRLNKVNKSNCLDASSDKKLLVVGETGGYMPRLILYDLETQLCLDDKRDQHNFGVLFTKFSPNGEYLLSVGAPQDGYVYVYGVKNRELEVLASNKCIANLKDIAWINDVQFVTVGTRHIKLWTFDGKLSGRSIVLGDLAEQSFESVSKFMGNTFLVGTSNGQVYKMPDAELYCEIDEEVAITSIIMNGNELTISTLIHMYTFKNQTLVTTYPYGARALSQASTSEKSPVLVLSSDRESPCIFPLGYPGAPFLFSKKGLKLRNATFHASIDYTDNNSSDENADSTRTNDSNGNEKVICWYADGNEVYEWPNKQIASLLDDISIASYDSCEDVLMLGSLSGDVELNKQIYNAHNGPVTDCHVVGKLAASSGRDRKVKIWFSDNNGDYKLVNELVFPAAVLRVQLMKADGINALICCVANKILYFYTSTTYEFCSPKTIAIRGMPYDMKAYKRSLILSTNDKTVTIYDPFSDDKQKKCRSWRPATSGLGTDSTQVNLTLIQPVEISGRSYLLGAGSNKCVMLYTLAHGDLVACQWGHGEQVSGIAWTKNELITASDNVFVSKLTQKQDIKIPSPPRTPRLRIPRSSTTDGISRGNTPDLQSGLSYQANGSPIRRSKSPSPPMSKLGFGAQLSPTASTRRPPRPSTRPSIPNLEPSPQRRLQPAMSTLKLYDNNEPNYTQNLEKALSDFLNNPIDNSDNGKNAKLTPLLISALAKIDGLQLVDVIAQKMSKKIEESLNNR